MDPSVSGDVTAPQWRSLGIFFGGGYIFIIFLTHLNRPVAGSFPRKEYFIKKVMGDQYQIHPPTWTLNQ